MNTRPAHTLSSTAPVRRVATRTVARQRRVPPKNPAPFTRTLLEVVEAGRPPGHRVGVPIPVAVLVQEQPDARRNLVARAVEIRDAQRRAVEVADPGEAEGPTEKPGQPFSPGLGGEVCPGCCLAGGGGPA